MDKYSFKDYRFDSLAYGLRKENRRCYSFSRQAAWQLYSNDEESTLFDENTWDDFWKELHRDYLERLQ